MTRGHGNHRRHHPADAADASDLAVQDDDQVLYGDRKSHNEYGLAGQLPTQQTTQGYSYEALSDQENESSFCSAEHYDDAFELIPRHERKRRLKAVEEARRYHLLEEEDEEDYDDDDHDRGGEPSRRNSNSGLPSFSWGRRLRLARGPKQSLLSSDGQPPLNPFAELEALVLMQQQQQQEQQHQHLLSTQQEPPAVEPTAPSRTVRAATAEGYRSVEYGSIPLPSPECPREDVKRYDCDRLGGGNCGENCKRQKSDDTLEKEDWEATSLRIRSATRSTKPVGGTSSSFGWLPKDRLPLPPTSSSLSLLEHSRRYPASSTKKKTRPPPPPRVWQHRPIFPPSSSASPLPTSGATTYGRGRLKQAKKRVVAPASRSIVGSRPVHWSIKSSAPTVEAASASLASFTKAQKSHVIAALDRRVVLQSSVSSNLQRTAGRSDRKKLRIARAGTNVSRGPDEETNRLSPSAGSTAEEKDSLTVTAERPPSAPVSFAPPFLLLTASAPCVPRSPIQELLVDDEGDDIIKESADELTGGFVSPGSTTPIPRGTAAWTAVSSSPAAMGTQPFHPPPRKRSKRNKPKTSSGLLHRLKAIRDDVRADSIRLQSGNYGMSLLGGGSRGTLRISAAYFGMNDPRSLAKSFMDVTILSDIPAVRDPNHGKLVYLVYCHFYSEGSGRIRQFPISPASSTARESAVEASTAVEGNVAWLYVTFATARERDLPTNRDLRIYNPIVFALSPRAIQATYITTATSTTTASSANSPSKSDVKHMIVATQICEAYPDQLPKLPSPSSILQILPAHAART